MVRSATMGIPMEDANTQVGEVGEGVTAVRSAKGRRTRARLIEAAAEVFAERQFLETNISDIAQRAGVSHGTFYTYFTSKEEIFREVALGLQDIMLRSRERFPEPPPGAPILDRIEWTNRSYLTAYREHVALFAVIEQVSTFNVEFRSIRRHIRNAYVQRSEQALARMQQEGSIHHDVDPRYVAAALGSMTDRFAYVWLVLGDEFEFDEAVRTLTLLWARAIGLDVPDGTLPDRRTPRVSEKRSASKKSTAPKKPAVSKKSTGSKKSTAPKKPTTSKRSAGSTTQASATGNGRRPR